MLSARQQNLFVFFFLKKITGLGADSVGKGLALQTQELGLIPRSHVAMSVQHGMLVVLALGRQRQEAPRDSMASQSRSVDEC